MPATQDQIRERAHALWEEAGRPDWRDQEFWIAAERELAERYESEDGPGPLADPVIAAAAAGLPTH